MMHFRHGPDSGTGFMPTDILLRITALAVAFYSGGSWYLTVPARLLCATILVFPPLLYAAWPWVCLLVITTFSNSLHWLVIDNHKYLITYWLLTVSLANSAGSCQGKILDKNGRGLIAACFVFAALWEVAGGEYFNGRFFTFTFLTDPRFATPTSLLTGIAPARLEANRVLLGYVRAAPAWIL